MRGSAGRSWDIGCVPSAPPAERKQSTQPILSLRLDQETGASQDRITTALVCPAIIVTLAVCVSIFLMTVVLPMLLENLVESGRKR